MLGKVIWLTGLSGSGKTTLSKSLYSKLIKLNFKVKRIDGDDFRKKNKIQNNFSKKNIYQNNISIIKNILKIQKKYDFIIVSVISPLLKTRMIAKKTFGKKYIEVYVKCGLRLLFKRDTKNLYKLAKKRLIKNLVGYNSKIAYEKSKYKKILVDTENTNIYISVKKLLLKIL